MPKKISSFSILNTITGNESIPILKDGSNFRILLTTIKSIFTKADVGLGNVDNTADVSKPISNATQIALNAKANTTHGHNIADVNNLQLTLDTKSALGHTHAQSDIVDLDTALADKAEVIHIHNTSDVLGLDNILNDIDSRLDNKSNSDHEHAIFNIAGLQTALDSKALNIHAHSLADVAGLIVTLNSKAELIHSHEIDNINNLSIVLSGKANTSHNHSIVDIGNLQSTLDSKSDISHIHSISQITGLQAALDAAGSGGGSVDISGKADITYVDSQLSFKSDIGHVHSISNITGLQLALDSKATITELDNRIEQLINLAPSTLNTLGELAAELGNLDVSIVNSLANKSDIGHIHTVSEITGLQTTLDDKASVASLAAKANVVHAHAIADITGLQAALDAAGGGGAIDISGKADITYVDSELALKSDVGHVHVVTDVSGLQTALDGKVTTSSYNTFVTDTLTALGNKSDLGHTHTISDINTLQTVLDDKASVASLSLKADQSALTSGLAAKADISHTHSIANVTGLQTALDNKADFSHTHSNILPTATFGQLAIYNGTDWVAYDLPYELSFAASDENTAITTGTSKVTLLSPTDFKLTEVVASLSSAQTSGSLLTIDVNVNASSVFGTLLTFDNNEKTSTTATTANALTTAEVDIPKYSEITVDVTQVGNGTAKGLKLYLSGYRYNLVAESNILPVTAGLAMWMDASDSLTLTISDSKVDSWTCKISGTIYSQNDVSLKPTVVAGNPGTNLKLQSLGFSGNRSVYLYNPTGLVGLDYPQTIFVVYKLNSGSGSYVSFGLFQNNSSGVISQSGGMPYVMMYKAPGLSAASIGLQSSLNVANYAYNNNNIVTSTPTPLNIAEMMFDTTSANTKFTFNGVDENSLVYTGSLNGAVTYKAIGAPDSLYLGNLDIGEILVFDRILTVQERTDVRTYLRNKWGTY
jgi:hypothetical protein